MSEKIHTINLSDLTPEARAQLIAQLREEELKVEAAETAHADEGVYTNTSPDAVTVADLGFRAGNSFTSETFAPGETKDLKTFYKLREIRGSKYLAKLSQPGGPLVRGRVTVDIHANNPMAALAALRPDGSFNDPLSGKREYDLKLKQVEADELRRNGDAPR